MPEYPTPDAWTYANARQKSRAARSFTQLRKRLAPVYQGPLFVDDEEQVRLQSAQDVARRLLVLWVVVLRSEGVPLEEVSAILDRHDLRSYISSEEKEFLQTADPDPDTCRRLEWRLEAIWVLLWSLNRIDSLDWPSDMCNVPKLVEVVKPFETDPNFIQEAKLRSVSEILDAQDLTMRIHWSIRDSYLNQRPIPVNLDWSTKEDWVPADLCAALGVVEQRHYTLNWLTKFLDPENWDVVDTPT